MSAVHDVAEVFPDLWADFAAILVAHEPSTAVRLVLLDDEPDDEVDAVVPDHAKWREGHAPQLLVRIAANVTAIEGIDVDDPQVEVQTASLLQDHVMDMLNRPWPIVTGGTGSGVAEPGVHDGTAVWVAAGREPVRFGGLARVLSE